MLTKKEMAIPSKIINEINEKIVLGKNIEKIKRWRLSSHWSERK